MNIIPWTLLPCHQKARSSFPQKSGKNFPWKKVTHWWLWRRKTPSASICWSTCQNSGVLTSWRTPDGGSTRCGRSGMVSSKKRLLFDTHSFLAFQIHFFIRWFIWTYLAPVPTPIKPISATSMVLDSCEMMLIRWCLWWIYIITKNYNCISRILKYL